MEKDSLLTFKKQYIAAMSREMKSPLEKIISLMTDSESAIAGRSAEIKDAARYLLSLVDELGTFADAHPQVKP